MDRPMKRYKYIEDRLDKKMCSLVTDHWLREYKESPSTTLEDADTWPAVSLWSQPGQKAVAWAVYQSPDYIGWQTFRVGLKGRTTKDKLRALWCRWEKSSWYALERDRINNYIGALKRGGQLNDKLEIVK